HWWLHRGAGAGQGVRHRARHEPRHWALPLTVMLLRGHGMFGLLPYPWELAFTLAPLVAVAVAVWLLVRQRGRPGPYSRIERIAIVALLVLFLLLLVFRPVARAPREYFQGRDQFEWVTGLHSPDMQTRRQALTALCTILKTSRSPSLQSWIVQEVGKQG